MIIPFWLMAVVDSNWIEVRIIQVLNHINLINSRSNRQTLLLCSSNEYTCATQSSATNTEYLHILHSQQKSIKRLDFFLKKVNKISNRKKCFNDLSAIFKSNWKKISIQFSIKWMLLIEMIIMESFLLLNNIVQCVFDVNEREN